MGARFRADARWPLRRCDGVDGSVSVRPTELPSRDPRPCCPLRLSRSHRRGARVDRQAAGGQPRTHHRVVPELWEQVYVVGHPGDLGRRAAPLRVAGGVSKTWYLVAIKLLGSTFIDANYDCPPYRWARFTSVLGGSANGALQPVANDAAYGRRCREGDLCPGPGVSRSRR